MTLSGVYFKFNKDALIFPLFLTQTFTTIQVFVNCETSIPAPLLDRQKFTPKRNIVCKSWLVKVIGWVPNKRHVIIRTKIKQDLRHMTATRGPFTNMT